MAARNPLLAGILRATADAVLAYESVRDGRGTLTDFRCTLANESAARLFPRPGGWEGSLLRRDSAAWAAPELWPRLKALAGGGTAVRTEHAVAGPDGPRWVSVVAEPLADGFVAVVKDLTGQRRPGEAPGAADRMLQAVFDTIPHPTFVKDRESRYVRVNRAMVELWKVPAERILGHRVVAPEDRPANETGMALETDRIALEGRAPVDRPMIQTLPDGRQRQMRIQKHPLFSESGEISGLVGMVEDVTDRLDAERALRESEQRLRNLVEGSLQGLTVLQDRRLVFGNLAFLRMFGIADETEARRVPPEDLVAPHERDRLLNYLHSRPAGADVPTEYEMECVRRDGTRFWAYFMSRIVEWNGKPATQTVFVDITRHKNAEQALDANRRLLRSVIDTLPHGIFVKDLEGRFILVNRVQAEYHGLAPQEFIGRTAADLPWPDRRFLAEILRAEQEAVELRRPGGIDEIEAVDDKGVRCVRRLIVLPLHGDRGTLEGTVGLSLDISAQVQARHDLQQAHAQLADAIESFPGSIVVYDRQERLYLWNSRVAETWPGLSDLLVVGTPHADFVRAGIEREEGLKGEALEARMREQRAEFAVAPRTRQIHTKDGRWFRFFANRMTGGGTIVVTIDITETQRHEDDLRQAQKMEAIGQLTGGIAHDFNNLLTVILGNADFLAETLDAQSQAAACARMIAQSALQGSALTHRLLAFARKQSLQPVELDLNQVAGGMGELIRRTLGEHIEIEMIRGGGLWKTQADPSQLEAALLNLAVNARDAMPDGGRLTIETANAWLDDSYAESHGDVRPGQYVLLSVTDTGRGMSREVAERAFDPFFTTKELGRGTGLGLSMVYGFVKQSGGHVKIYTELGHGTSVKIYLPRYSGPPQQPDPPAAPDGPLPRGVETVLVVEDDELVRINTVQQLESLGYQVVAVADARGALDMLERLERVHLLFTDVIMPGGMNGRQLAEEAQRTWPGLKVLFASGYTPNSIVHHGRLDPGIHLVSKPYRKAELARKVRRVLEE